MDQGSVQYFSELDDTALSALSVEGRLTIRKALDLIDTSEEQTLVAFDQLMALSQRQDKTWIDVAVETDFEITTSLLTLIMHSYLGHWEDGSYRSFPFVEWLELICPDVVSAKGTIEARLLHAELQAIEGIALIDQERKFEMRAAQQALEGFYQMAILLDNIGYLDLALACALSAINFSVLLDPSDRERISSLALRLSRKTANPDNIALCTALHADVLLTIAETDQERKVEAFDAFETVLRQLLTVTELRRVGLDKLMAWFDRAPYLKPLKGILWMALPLDERVDLPEALDEKGIRAALSQIWEGNNQEWFEYLDYSRELSPYIENARLALQPAIPSHAALATWADWSIDHPSLRRAVPQSLSLLQEANLYDILLILNHEITHIYSMVGLIGMASLALRWAVSEFELYLWTLNYETESFDQAAFNRAKGLAPLAEPNVIALAEAEQAVETARKRQVLEDAWAPWFEGLAVFGELAADPQMDAAAYSPITAVIYNLLDKHPVNLAEEAGIGITEVIQQERANAEKLYAEAIRRNGGYRLRSYLGRYHRKYLAGYLTVRSVVAAWRTTLDKAITGAQAFRILLFLTRHGTLEAIPDLSLPLEAFQEAVIQQQREWLHAIAAISANDLERLIDGFLTEDRPSVKLSWRHGRLQDVSSVEDLQEQDIELIELFGEQALASLRGELAPVDRVPEADEACREIMKVTASSLTNVQPEPGLLNARSVGTLINRQLILPIGRAACPFWLMRGDRRLNCLIRTTEYHRERHQPSYNMISIPLTEGEFDALEEEIRLRGQSRIMVTRVVDLADHDLEGDPAISRGDGMNLLVFQYGDWFQFQAAGLSMGRTELAPSLLRHVQARLSSNPVLEIFDWLNGDSNPGARRTMEWIETSQDWVISFASRGVELEVDITAWAERVRRVAEAVLARQPRSVTYEENMFNFVFDDAETASRLASEGLSMLANYDSSLLRDFIRLLDASARAPISDAGIDNNLVTRLLGPVVVQSEHGWDVTPPTTYRSLT